MPKKQNTKRISKDQYYLEIAKTVSCRSTCFRRMQGAIVVSCDDEVVGTGYCGAPRGTKDCFERGFCIRSQQNIPAGERYELCRSVHAEQNALLAAGKQSIGADMFIYAKSCDDQPFDTFPCFMCKRVIINARIKRVICSTKTGGMNIFHVKDWVDEWKKQDIVDDKHQYGK